MRELDKVDYRLYFSDRDLPLIYCGPPQRVPVLTVENYCKWYNLWLVTTDGKVRAYRPSNELLKKIEPPGADIGLEFGFYGDHTFNPALVAKAAEIEDFIMDEMSWEIIIGRWESETKETYSVCRPISEA